jgi:crotonobetainyl-CoA:carnitine CoA-transferase CaiB-like acyl-CoA transferase
MSPTPERRPLAGITVVSLEQAVAAPFAARQLALGGRVEMEVGGPHPEGVDEDRAGLRLGFVDVHGVPEGKSV